MLGFEMARACIWMDLAREPASRGSRGLHAASGCAWCHPHARWHTDRNMHLPPLLLLLQEPCAGTLCLGAPADDVAKYINKNKAQWGVPANVTFQLCNMWNGSPLDQDRGGPATLHCTVSPCPA
jgi:hypothetical protein